MEYPEVINDQEVEEITKKMSYNIVRCLGCDTHSFMETFSFSNDLDENDKPLVYINTYPDDDYESDELSEIFLKPAEIRSLPLIVRTLYGEIITAFEYKALILAGIGLRSLIEALCIQQSIPGRDLKEKIENLHKEGYLSKKEMPALQKLRQIGNATVHEIKSLQLLFLIIL
jgi:hypothetical protein